MKQHGLCSNWQIVFMSDTDKQTLNRSVLVVVASA